MADSFLGLLGEASDDKFNPDLLRDEPTDKVGKLCTTGTVTWRLASCTFPRQTLHTCAVQHLQFEQVLMRQCQHS